MMNETSGSVLNILKSMLGRENLSKILSVASIVALSLVFVTINPRFLVSKNITNILNDMSPLWVMACGVAFVLMLSSIDLSLGSIASCSAVMLTVLFSSIGPFAYPIVIMYGMLAGLINGMLHTYLKIPSFIATLCTQSIWQSVALLIAGAKPLPMLPPVWPYIEWVKITFGVVPILFIISFLLMLLYTVIQKKTKVGRTMLALGENEGAARLIGLDINKAKVTAFFLSGIAASIGGIIFAVKLKSGIPTVGAQYNLMAIASAALGGVALSGGKGDIPMTIIGAGLIIIIQNGMNVIAVDGYWQQIVFGALVLIAIYINADHNRRDLVVK
jgi:ribose/xylose/arabinose/galactoside ABC-type transport system permease subunit